MKSCTKVVQIISEVAQTPFLRTFPDRKHSSNLVGACQEKGLEFAICWINNQQWQISLFSFQSDLD